MSTMSTVRRSPSAVRRSVRGVPHIVTSTERRIPPMPATFVGTGKHISAIDWAGIAQRMADALDPDHPARAEFDMAAANSEIVDLGNGGSVTVLAGAWAAMRP